MKKITPLIFAIIFTTNLYAQSLSVKDKTLDINNFPEYIVINCDNITPPLGNTISIVIQVKNSNYEKSLNDLQDVLENKKYLKITNQTDLLNTMSKFGFDYINSFPQNATENSLFNRTGFIFRKKEKFRN